MSRHGSAVCVVHSRSHDGRHFLVEARRWPARWNVGHICLIQLAFFRSLLGFAICERFRTDECTAVRVVNQVEEKG